MSSELYQEALTYLLDQLPMFQRSGPRAMKKDLHNIQVLMTWLGDPHKAFKVVHIAGTNGKGSVGHLIAASLDASDYKTGLYTSPHYLDYRERIKISGQLIDEMAVVEFVQTYRQADLGIEPSFFELTVAMAFWYFRREGVEVGVIETGLGGRLDSTNVVHPDISIITNISFDHMDMLGDTLPRIAREKAGIIKSARPVIIGRRQDETAPVFEEVAKSLSSPIAYAEELIRDQDPIYQDILSSPTWSTTPHAAENVRTALAALQWMDRRLAFDIKMDILPHALDNVRSSWFFIGRYMLLGSHPRVIADSAHNEEGVRTLMKHVALESNDKLHIIMAVVKDKDCSLLWPHLPKQATYYFTSMSLPRSKSAEALTKEGRAAGCYGEAYTSVEQAYAQAKANAKDTDTVLVMGSIFLLADLLTYLKDTSQWDPIR